MAASFSRRELPAASVIDGKATRITRCEDQLRRELGASAIAIEQIIEALTGGELALALRLAERTAQRLREAVIAVRAPDA